MLPIRATRTLVLKWLAVIVGRVVCVSLIRRLNSCRLSLGGVVASKFGCALSAALVVSANREISSSLLLMLCSEWPTWLVLLLKTWQLRTCLSSCEVCVLALLGIIVIRVRMFGLTVLMALLVMLMCVLCMCRTRVTTD